MNPQAILHFKPNLDLGKTNYSMVIKRKLEPTIKMDQKSTIKPNEVNQLNMSINILFLCKI